MQSSGVSQTDILKSSSTDLARKILESTRERQEDGMKLDVKDLSNLNKNIVQKLEDKTSGLVSRVDK